MGYNIRYAITHVMNNRNKKMVSEVNEEILLYVRKLAERERLMQKELEKQYVLGLEDGFADGVTVGYEKGQCETWDEAYTAGYRAAKDEEL